jgi:hypothetical protein
MLVGTISNSQEDILLDMGTFAHALGPKALTWLKSRYQSGDLPTALKVMMSIFNSDFDNIDTVVTDMTGLVTLNARSVRLRVPDDLLCALS